MHQTSSESPFDRWGNRGSEMLNGLQKVTQLGSGNTGM